MIKTHFIARITFTALTLKFPVVVKAVLFCGTLTLFLSSVCHAFASVHCCLLVTCWERADLLTLVCYVYCDFVTFPFGTMGKVWYLIVSIPDPCCPIYFATCGLLLYRN